jgi:DnaJ-class molecular chaperone
MKTPTAQHPKRRDFTPSPELKSLFREVVKRVHPDFCKDAGDLERRTRFMADANRAYEAGDAETLQRILDEYQDGADALEGEGIGAELIRIIRQISQARERVAAIERELAVLRQSEIALLRNQAEERAQEGRDLLAELASAVREQIERAKKEWETLANQG